MKAISKEHTKKSIRDIPNLEADYVLKCVNGLYKGRFIYLKRTPQGEKIGSASIDKKNGLTMRIEGADVEEYHVKIAATEDGSFTLSDLGTKSGTWKRVEGRKRIDLKSVYCVNEDIFCFSAGRKVNFIEEIFSKFDMPELTDACYAEGIFEPEDLQTNYSSLQKKFTSSASNRKNEFDEIISNYVPSFLADSEFLRTKYLIKFIEGNYKGIDIEFGYKGASLGKCPEANAQLKSLSFDESSLLTIEFTSGRYFLALSQGNDFLFEKLKPQENAKFCVDDLVKLGRLIFRLDRFHMGSAKDNTFTHSAEAEFLNKQGLKLSDSKICSLFAVFEGINGQEATLFLKNNLCDEILQRLTAKDGKSLKYLIDSAEDIDKLVIDGVKEAFANLDFKFRDYFKAISKDNGAVVSAILLVGARMYTITLGNCKIYSFSKGKAVEIGSNHSLENQEEQARVEKAGATAILNRINGRLNITRCIGYFEMKRLEERQKKLAVDSILLNEPEVNTVEIEAEDEFILLMTNGITKALSAQELAGTIKSLVIKNPEMDPAEMIEDLFSKAKQTRKIESNMCGSLLFLKRTLK